jgi:hypothetical protein
MNKRAAIATRLALGSTAGPLQLRAQSDPSVQGAMPRETRFRQNLCADIDGFRCIAAIQAGSPRC